MTAIDSNASSGSNSTRRLSPSALLSRNHFVLRRLHSLSGVIPVGLFVCVHLFTNAQMIWGQDPATGKGEFQHEVDFIHSMTYL